MANLPAITQRSTKNELMTAFEELKREYEALKTAEVKPALRREEENKLAEKTAAYTPANIESELLNLRRRTQEEIDRLSRDLAAESAKLSELRQAIAVQTERLKETRQIELAADTLDNLMADYARTEKELSDKKRAAEESLNIEIAQRKKEWQREQEEYAYNLKIAQKKEGDAYEMETAKKDAAREEKNAARLKELEERESVIKTNENEFSHLQKLAADQPALLEVAAKSAEQKTADALRKEFATEKRILEQEWNAGKNMLEAKLENALDTIKSQASEIISLKKALELAGDRAQTLAATVIESVSGTKQLKTVETMKE